MLHNIGYVLGELAMTTHSVHGPKGQDIQGSFTNRTLYKGKIEEAIHFSNTPPPSQIQGGSTTLSLERRKQC
jgi:hypothetical protein